MPLIVVENATSRLSGGLWSHNDTIAGNLSRSMVISAAAQKDVLDNLFRGEALHPGHSRGMRDDYLTNVWNLKVNLEVPAGSQQDQSFTRLEPAEPLFEINGRVLYLSKFGIESIKIKFNT